jgi:hypothetical protein
MSEHGEHGKGGGGHGGHRGRHPQRPRSGPPRTTHALPPGLPVGAAERYVVERELARGSMGIIQVAPRRHAPSAGRLEGAESGVHDSRRPIPIRRGGAHHQRSSAIRASSRCTRSASVRRPHRSSRCSSSRAARFSPFSTACARGRRRSFVRSRRVRLLHIFIQVCNAVAYAPQSGASSTATSNPRTSCSARSVRFS